MKATRSLDNSEACSPETSVPALHVTLLGGEWSSSAGGLSTINRELAIHLSSHSAVKVSLLVPEGACNYEETNEALTYGISIVEAKRRAAFDRLVWLSSPPKDHVMDIVVGHGVKLGRQVQFIRDSAQFPNCKWVQVVHTAPEDLSKYKCYTDPISKGEAKHESEVELCKLADLVVPVGPKLKEAYTSYLQRCKTDQDVLSITPGLFQREFGDLVAKQDPNEYGEFKVLIFGRGDDEDFELKGYNIAAQAFTDQRLKNKPYHLIFVGAPEGKQEEVREKLLQHGIAEAQLTVRKFIESRERLKDLLCEADLAIMPSKSEGFGLVALESLSAGLPILVGSKSGFAKALENVLHGYSCIVNSDDPTKWAEAIEAVRVRHRMRLEEIKTLKASYGKMYSWEEQCEALVERMWKMIHGSSKNGNKPRNEETFRAEKSAHFAAGSQPKSSCKVIPDIITKHCFQELNDEQSKIVRETLERQVQAYMRFRNISTAEGVSGLIEHIQETYNLALKSVGFGSLEITFQCPSLESLERLWSDYQSGDLNDVAERYLVTDDIKKKLNLKNIRLKTTIEDENYRICRMILMEEPLLPVTSESPLTESDQETALPPICTSADVCKDKKLVLTPMERAEKAKASRGPLHKAAISGQYETVKMLLESGEDVDKKDQFSLTPLHLACWYGQEPVVKLLLQHGANVNAEDKFQRTPLQKAERQNHHSIVQLLVKNDARPSLYRPVIFPGKTAAEILSLIRRRNPSHDSIKRRYREPAKDNSRLTELQWATCNDDSEQAVELVLNDGVYINALASDSDYTALLQASRSSSSQYIETLIDLGADVNIQRKESKETPLILAAECNNYMTSYLLVRHGADVNVQDSSGFTPLHVSVKKGYTPVVRMLLEYSSDVNIQDNDGCTPLHWSLKQRDENLCRLLLKHNADVNIEDNEGYAPLDLADKSGDENIAGLLLSQRSDMWNDEKVLRLLLEPNADVNIQDDDGKTALLWSVYYDDEYLVRLLLDYDADANIQDKRGNTALAWSVKKGHKTFARMLLEHHADANIQDKRGYTPLRWAVEKGRKTLVIMLLEHSADTNIQDKRGYTLLQWAINNGDKNLCKLLLEHNADVNIQDKDGYTPLDWSYKEGDEDIVRLLLIHQSVMWNDEKVHRLLLEPNAGVNIQDNDGFTPLYRSVINGKAHLVKLLLEHKADANIQDKRGYTPLQWAVHNGDEKLYKLLLEHNADANVKDKRGCTLLHWAVKKGRENLVRILLEHKAEVNIQDNSGVAALHWAVEEGYENFVRILLEHNADVNVQNEDGMTPLHQSVVHDDVDIAGLLLQHNADVNIQDKDGDTPMYCSIRYRSEGKVIDFLLKCGAQDINIRDAKGCSPLHLAVRCGNAKAVKKLVDVGADVSVVQADKKDAVELERLKNEAESMERQSKMEEAELHGVTSVSSAEVHRASIKGEVFPKN